jgi:hypothetical protein
MEMGCRQTLLIEWVPDALNGSRQRVNDGKEKGAGDIESVIVPAVGSIPARQGQW